MCAVQEPPTKLAAKRLGVHINDLKPRSLQSFKEGPTDTPEAMQIKYVATFRWFPVDLF